MFVMPLSCAARIEIERETSRLCAELRVTTDRLAAVATARLLEAAPVPVRRH